MQLHKNKGVRFISESIFYRTRWLKFVNFRCIHFARAIHKFRVLKSPHTHKQIFIHLQISHITVILIELIAAAREVIRRESWQRGIRVSEGTINAWLELKFGRLQPDPDLVRYFTLLKADLAADEEDENDEMWVYIIWLQ